MESRVKKVELKIKTIEEAILLLSQQTLIHSNWFDEIREAQANTDVKIAALVDAQIRNEDESKASRTNTDVKIAALVDAQIRNEDEAKASRTNTDAKIAALVDAQIRNEDELKEHRKEMKELRNDFTKYMIKLEKRIELLEKKNGDGKNGKNK